MKNLFLLGVLFLGCTSHHGEVFPKPPALTLTPNETTYEQVVASKTNPGDCVDFLLKKYCGWNSGILVFNEQKFQKEIPLKASPLFYSGNVKTMGDATQQSQKIWLTSATKNGEWKTYHPLIVAIFTSTGMQVVKNKKDADQIVRVSFTERYLNLVSTAKTKAKAELWSIDLSRSAGVDLSMVLPIHAAIARSYLANFREDTREFKVSENDVNIVSFKDFTNTPQ